MKTLAEKYFFLFTDTFYNNLIISMNNEMAIWVMHKIGCFNTIALLFYGFLGVLCAAVINYIFGYLTYNIFIKSAQNNNSYMIVQNIFSSYGGFILLLCFFSIFAKLLLVLCGVMRYKFLRSVLIMSLCRVFYYLLYVYS